MLDQITLNIFLAIIQGITEFLPVSSDGHLALLSNLYGQPDLSFFVFLHLASLLAVIIFTRKEIIEILKFKKENNTYLFYLILGIIPAGIVGFLLKETIERQFDSLLVTGFGFIFTGIILLFTKNSMNNSKLSSKSALSVGFMQIFALLPGVSRSGMTISTAKFFGIKNEEAFKFSFLLLIPLTIGAFILDIKEITSYSHEILLPFFVCLFTSLVFLRILKKIVVEDKFWMFSFYCFAIGIITLILHLLL